MEEVRESIFNKHDDRLSVRNLAIIITESSKDTLKHNPTSVAVEAAKDDGITLIALGIGPGANSTVQSLASSPELGLILPDYDREVMKEELVSIICNSPSGWWFRNFWLPYPGSPCVGTDISDIYLIPHKILFSLHMIKIHNNRNINDETKQSQQWVRKQRKLRGWEIVSYTRCIPKVASHKRIESRTKRKLETLCHLWAPCLLHENNNLYHVAIELPQLKHSRCRYHRSWYFHIVAPAQVCGISDANALETP